MTTSSKPNYKLAAKAAYDLLERLKLSVFPISLFDIIEAFPQLKVFSFIEMAQLLNIDVQTVANKMAFSEEGAIGTFGTDQIIIIYNSDISLKNLGRERFTLAHEIGHFILGHPFKTDNSILSRHNGITSLEDDIFEKEANHFARELLAPTFLVDDVEPLTVENVANRFEISNEASEYSIARVEKGRNRIGWFHLNLSVPTNWIFGNPSFYSQVTYVKKITNISSVGLVFTGEGLNFSYKKIVYCNNCRSIKIYNDTDKIAFCSFCKNKDLKEVNSYNYFKFHEKEEQRLMAYSELKVEENGRLNENCPICNNDHVSDNYCSVCGIYIFNECSGIDDAFEEETPCDGPLLGSDRYCPKCGAKSTFFKNGLLKEWYAGIPLDISNDDLPF